MFCCGIPVGRSARAAITHDHHAPALDGTVVDKILLAELRLL